MTNTTLNDPSVLLAFDIGRKRTGVASGHSVTQRANPAGQLLVNNGRFDWPALDKLIQEWQPDALVIGNPNTSDPALNKVINRFKSHIQQQHKLPIIEIDERLSSAAANTELAGQNLRLHKKTQLRDQIAACLILESYFNSVTAQ